MAIWGLILSLSLFINLAPFPSLKQNIIILNTLLFLLAIYTLVYYRLLAPRFESEKTILISIILYAIFVSTVVHFSGGIQSVLFSLTLIPILVSAEMLGLYALGIVSLIEFTWLIVEGLLWGGAGGVIELTSPELFGARIMTLGITAFIAAINASEISSRLREREDLTREKERWRRLKEKSDAILHSMTDGVIVLGKTGEIISANERAEEILLSPDLVGQGYEDILPLKGTNGTQLVGTDEDPILRVLRGREESNKGVYLVESGETSEKKFLSLAAMPLVGEDGALIIFSNVTEEQELDRMKLDFVSMASHELRTPITSIMGYLSLIKEEAMDRLTEEERQFIERAFIAGQKLEALMENLLSVSQVEKGDLSLDLKEVDWNELIREQLEDFRSQAEQSGLELRTSLASDLPPVEVDKLRIGEVLNNLLSNALSYTYEGEVEISTYRSADGQFIITSIRDTGQGIPQEAIPHLFTKFYRVSGVLEQGSKGTGLGLYISQAIVKAHQGNIWAESRLNEGSTFFFSLPVAD